MRGAPFLPTLWHQQTARPTVVQSQTPDTRPHQAGFGNNTPVHKLPTSTRWPCVPSLQHSCILSITSPGCLELHTLYFQQTYLSSKVKMQKHPPPAQEICSHCSGYIFGCIYLIPQLSSVPLPFYFLPCPPTKLKASNASPITTPSNPAQ
jgi:hypothetical protein